MKRKKFIGLLLACLLLSACGTGPSDPADHTEGPGSLQLIIG